MAAHDSASNVSKLASLVQQGKKAGTSVKIDGLDAQVSSLKQAKEMGQSKSFSSVLEGYIDEVNELQFKADSEIEKVAKGEAENLHDVTMAMEEAETSFQLMMEIRNKLVDAYEELKRMQ